MRITILSIASALLLAACGTAHVQSSAPPLGLWVSTVNEQQNSLELHIEKTEGMWRAQIQSEPAEIQMENGLLSVEGPDGQSFTGRLGEGGQKIEGRWFQPITNLGYQDMVTPIEIPLRGANEWYTTLVGQPRPFTIFLDVFEGDDQETLAVIRNPERNEIVRAAPFRVLPQADGAWVLLAGKGEREVRVALTRTDSQTLSLEHRRFDAGVSLRQANEQDALTYYSRPQSDKPAQYTHPAQLDDGWQVATPEQAGLDRKKLDALVADLVNTNPRDDRPRMVHSMLVAHKGKLVFEEYFNGHTRETPHDTRSLAKVFGPVLMGAMRQQGYAISPKDRPIADILKQAGEGLDNPRKADITLAHLMSFTSGLDCDSSSSTSPGSEDNMWSQDKETDFWLYTARLESLHTPGERYAYCSGSINLVGASLRAAAGKPIVETFDDLIAKPLQFSPYHWDLAPNGAAYLGGGVYMRPRDILKIGALHAAGGSWNGKRVLSEDWVAESTRAKIAITPETTGLSKEDFGNNYFGGSSAYIWVVNTVTAGERAYASYAATGNGGQILVVVPELALVAAFTGGNYRMGSIWGRWPNELVGRYIIPALSEDK